MRPSPLAIVLSLLLPAFSKYLPMTISGTTSLSTPATPVPNCPDQGCFPQSLSPDQASEALAFCSSLLRSTTTLAVDSTITIAETVTSTVIALTPILTSTTTTATTTEIDVTSTRTTTITSTITITIPRTNPATTPTTSPASVLTPRFFPWHRAHAPIINNHGIPRVLAQYPAENLGSACSCILKTMGIPTTTVEAINLVTRTDEVVVTTTAES